MTPDDSDRDSEDEVEVRIVEEPAGRDLDRRLTDLLGRLLDTETRGKVYVQVLRDPGATSEAVARGTGLYPETVRRMLADLREEGVIDRREIEGEEGRYGYTAVPPTALAGRLLGEFQDGLDVLLGTEDNPTVDPVTIDVEEVPEDNGDDRYGGSDGNEDDRRDDGFSAGDR